MKLNYCPTCGTKVLSYQNFCANCGTDLTELKGKKHLGDFKSQMEFMMKELLEHNAGVLKELAEKIAKGETLGKGLFFSIEMRDGKPIIKTGEMKDFENLIKDAPIPSFIREMMEKEKGIEFKEAEVSTRIIKGKKEVVIRVPGIRSIEDVEIKKNSQNLEVIGRVGNTIYYSLIPIEEGSIVLGTRLLNDTVIIDIKQQ